jgi:hypothetical protein
VESVSGMSSIFFIPKLDFYTRQALGNGIGEEQLVGGESDLVYYELINIKNALITDEGIPVNELDTVTTEMSFKYGRADIIIFHIDGSATVIEAKDGTKGYNHVVSGIGQVSLYASQLSNRRVNLREIRRALLWSSSGDHDEDDQIKEACSIAGVIPMLRSPIREMNAITMLTAKFGIDAIAKMQKERSMAFDNYCNVMLELIEDIRNARKKED